MIRKAVIRLYFTKQLKQDQIPNTANDGDIGDNLRRTANKTLSDRKSNTNVQQTYQIDVN